MKDRVMVIMGLGTFGASLATRLSHNGCRVTGIDSDESRVSALRKVLYEPVVADVTDRAALEPLMIDRAEVVFISLGEEIEKSILAALHARDLGAREVFARGVSEDHARILKALGVKEVIFPEEEIARVWADNLTWRDVLKHLVIDDRHEVVEMAVPNSLVGKTLQQSDLRRRHGILVIGVKDALHGGALTPAPGGDHVLSEDEMLLVLGSHEAITAIRGTG